MKKFLLIMAANTILALSLNAQNTVNEVLASMPAECMKDVPALAEKLAKEAPASVTTLASMLQSAETGANNKIEYALNALANFASDPENAAYKDAVKKGFKEAVASQKDTYNRAFLETQLRLLSPEKEPKPAYKNKNIKKYSKVYGKKLNVKKGLSNPERKYRGQFLRALNADDQTMASIAQVFPTLSDDAKTDVLNWLGDSGNSTLIGNILGEFASQNAEVSNAAIRAAGKLGGQTALLALIGQLGTGNDEAAHKALLEFNGDIRGTVAETIKKARGTMPSSLMELAAERHVTDAAPSLFRLAEREDRIALDCLSGVVGTKDMDRLCKMLDSENFAISSRKYLKKALNSSLSTLDKDEQYSLVAAKIAGATHPERFYNTLAYIGNDDAVKDLCTASDNGSKPAFDALLLVDNYLCAPQILKAAQGGNQKAVEKLVNLVDQYESLEGKFKYFSEALTLTEDNVLKKNIIDKLEEVNLPEVFNLVGGYLNNDDLGIKIAAAHAAKKIGQRCKDKIDPQKFGSILELAAKAYAERGFADDMYAVEEIKKILGK